MNDLRSDVIALMQDAGTAHHDAFAAVDGADAEWPLWYAQHIYLRLKERLPGHFTQSELVYAFVKAERAYKVQKPESTWQEYYADLLMSEFTK